jgi:flagellar protein FliS
MTAQFKAYATNQYLQMSPERLVLALFDGALTNMYRAEDAIHEGSVARKGEAISKAIAIVAELQASLNHDAGGELADRLEALYDYVIRGLVQVNIGGDVEKLEHLRGLISETREGWAGMMEALARDAKAATGAGYF